MIGYIQEALASFNHPRPQKLQDQLHLHVKPRYGTAKQYAPKYDTSPP